MDNIIDENYSTMLTPNLYAPPSDNIALQWTYRNGTIVNLPWILLVEGDIILLRSGRESPARCKRLKSPVKITDLSPSEFESGQIYIPDEVYKYPSSLAVQPFEPLLCVITETAVLRYVRTCLSAAGRPPSLLENEYRRIIHFYMERFVVPACLTLSVFVAALCYIFTDNSNGSWYETLILRPFLVVLPIVSPIVPMFTFVFYLFNTSVLLTEFIASKDGASAMDASSDVTSLDATKNETTPAANVPAGSNLDLFFEEPTSNQGKKFHRRRSSFLKNIKSVSSKMIDLALGESSSLPFSANIVFTLGNLTSLSVIDKKVNDRSRKVTRFRKYNIFFYFFLRRGFYLGRILVQKKFSSFRRHAIIEPFVGNIENKAHRRVLYIVRRMYTAAAPMRQRITTTTLSRLFRRPPFLRTN